MRGDVRRRQARPLLSCMRTSLLQTGGQPGSGFLHLQAGRRFDKEGVGVVDLGDRDPEVDLSSLMEVHRVCVRIPDCAWADPTQQRGRSCVSTATPTARREGGPDAAFLFSFHLPQERESPAILLAVGDLQPGDSEMPHACGALSLPRSSPRWLLGGCILRHGVL